MSPIIGKCPICGKGYFKKLNMTHHVLWFHDGKECLKCLHLTPEECELCRVIPEMKSAMGIGPDLTKKESLEELHHIWDLCGSPAFWKGGTVMAEYSRLMLLKVRAPKKHEDLWEAAVVNFEMRQKMMGVAF